MKRTRLGVDDFEPLKVIGRGAFGEVSSVLSVQERNVDYRQQTYKPITDCVCGIIRDVHSLVMASPG